MCLSESYTCLLHELGKRIKEHCLLLLGCLSEVKGEGERKREGGEGREMGGEREREREKEYFLHGWWSIVVCVYHVFRRKRIIMNLKEGEEKGVGKRKQK